MWLSLLNIMPDVAFAPTAYAIRGFQMESGGNPAIVLCDPRISAANFSTCDASTFDSGHAPHSSILSQWMLEDVPEHRIKATMASVLEVLVLECYGIDRAR